MSGGIRKEVSQTSHPRVQFGIHLHCGKYDIRFKSLPAHMMHTLKRICDSLAFHQTYKSLWKKTNKLIMISLFTNTCVVH